MWVVQVERSDSQIETEQRMKLPYDRREVCSQLDGLEGALKTLVGTRVVTVSKPNQENPVTGRSESGSELGAVCAEKRKKMSESE
jgi:hypothetical protein